MGSKAWGQAVLVGSALGYPLSELVLRRAGGKGAAAVEVVCIGLTIRDLALIRSGAPGRLRPLPATLLWMEAVAAAVAAGSTGCTALHGTSVSGAGRSESESATAMASASPASPASGPGSAPAPARPLTRERLRSWSLGMLFGLHTVRFWIYLRPDRGLRRAGGTPG